MSATMTADEFREALDSVGYTQVAFADLVGADHRTARRWALGEVRIPGAAVIILRLMLARPEMRPVIEGLAGGQAPVEPTE